MYQERDTAPEFFYCLFDQEIDLSCLSGVLTGLQMLNSNGSVRLEPSEVVDFRLGDCRIVHSVEVRH